MGQNNYANDFVMAVVMHRRAYTLWFDLVEHDFEGLTSASSLEFKTARRSNSCDVALRVDSLRLPAISPGGN